MIRHRTTASLLVLFALTAIAAGSCGGAEPDEGDAAGAALPPGSDWPQWRGPGGRVISDESGGHEFGHAERC